MIKNENDSDFTALKSATLGSNKHQLSKNTLRTKPVITIIEAKPLNQINFNKNCNGVSVSLTTSQKSEESTKTPIKQKPSRPAPPCPKSQAKCSTNEVNSTKEEPPQTKTGPADILTSNGLLDSGISVPKQLKKSEAPHPRPRPRSTLGCIAHQVSKTSDSIQLKGTAKPIPLPRPTSLKTLQPTNRISTTETSVNSNDVSSGTTFLESKLVSTALDKSNNEFTRSTAQKVCSRFDISSSTVEKLVSNCGDIITPPKLKRAGPTIIRPISKLLVDNIDTVVKVSNKINSVEKNESKTTKDSLCNLHSSLLPAKKSDSPVKPPRIINIDKDTQLPSKVSTTEAFIIDGVSKIKSAAQESIKRKPDLKPKPKFVKNVNAALSSYLDSGSTINKTDPSNKILLSPESIHNNGGEKITLSDNSHIHQSSENSNYIIASSLMNCKTSHSKSSESQFPNKEIVLKNGNTCDLSVRLSPTEINENIKNELIEDEANFLGKDILSVPESSVKQEAPTSVLVPGLPPKKPPPPSTASLRNSKFLSCKCDQTGENLNNESVKKSTESEPIYTEIKEDPPPKPTRLSVHDTACQQTTTKLSSQPEITATASDKPLLSAQASLPLPQHVVSGPHCVALYDFEASRTDELSFLTGDVISLISDAGDNWMCGRLLDQEGMFPLNFVEIIEPLPLKPQKPSRTFEEDKSSIDQNTDIPESGNCSKTESSCAPFLESISLDPDSEPTLFINNGKSDTNNTTPDECSEGVCGEAQINTCVALYDFIGEQSGDLSFKCGDVIQVLERVNNEWTRGRLLDKEGIFPADFVRVSTNSSGYSVSTPSVDENVVAIAEYDFFSLKRDELSFKSGDIITNLSSEDNGWIYGCLDNKSGIFPSNFVKLSKKNPLP